MELALYQIVIIVLAGAMIFQGLRNFFRQEGGQTALKLLVRLIVWGGMIVITLFPEFTIEFARFIGIEGNVNAVTATAFVLVFLMMFKLLSTIERLEQQMTALVRKDALEETNDRK